MIFFDLTSSKFLKNSDQFTLKHTISGPIMVRLSSRFGIALTYLSVILTIQELDEKDCHDFLTDINC